MAENIFNKQSYPDANTLTDLYTVPAGTQTVTATFTACNQADTSTHFWWSVAPNGEADDPKHYTLHKTFVDAHDTYAATFGEGLPTASVMRVKSENGNVSFHISGIERS